MSQVQSEVSKELEQVWDAVSRQSEKENAVRFLREIIQKPNFKLSHLETAFRASAVKANLDFISIADVFVAKNGKAPSKGRASRTRMSAEQKKNICDAVADILKSSKGLKKADILNQLDSSLRQNINSQKLGTLLSEMKMRKRIKSKGEKAKTIYHIAA